MNMGCACNARMASLGGHQEKRYSISNINTHMISIYIRKEVE